MTPEEAYFEQFSGEEDYFWRDELYQEFRGKLDPVKRQQLLQGEWKPVIHFVVAPDHHTFTKYCRKHGLGPNEIYRIDAVKKLGGLQNQEIEILVTSYPYPNDQKAVLEALDQASVTHNLKLVWIGGQ